MMKKIVKRFTGWLVKKTGYDFPLPIQPVIIKPENLKKFHVQRIVPNHEWLLRQVEPDCFIRQFKYDVVDELLKEIQIKVEETPNGIMYSADLLFKNV